MKYHIPYGELYHLYIEENMRRKEIAEHYGCSDSLIKKRLRGYGITKPHELEVENKRREGYTKKCDHCGVIYETKSRNFHGKRSRYCSQECSQKSRDLGEEHRHASHLHHAALRRQRVRGASVDLTEEEKKQIVEIYKNCPDGHEVDHIVPIARGGLHHPENLQYLTVKENRSKGCKLL